MRIALLVLGTAVLLPPSSAAQFGVSGELGLGFMGGTDHDTASVSLRPYRPATYTIRPEWEFGRVRVGLGLTYSTPHMAFEGSYTIVSSDAEGARLLEAAPELSYRLLRTSTGVSLRVHGGPVLDTWSVMGETTAEWGGQLALSTEMPLAARWHLTIRGTGVITSSVYDQGDFPPEIKVEAMRRGTVSLGVRYGP
jgi:hypothetical protein